MSGESREPMSTGTLDPERIGPPDQQVGKLGVEGTRHFGNPNFPRRPEILGRTRGLNQSPAAVRAQTGARVDSDSDGAAADSSGEFFESPAAVDPRTGATGNNGSPTVVVPTLEGAMKIASSHPIGGSLGGDPPTQVPINPPTGSAQSEATASGTPASSTPEASATTVQVPGPRVSSDTPATPAGSATPDASATSRNPGEATSPAEPEGNPRERSEKLYTEMMELLGENGKNLRNLTPEQIAEFGKKGYDVLVLLRDHPSELQSFIAEKGIAGFLVNRDGKVQLDPAVDKVYQFLLDNPSEMPNNFNGMKVMLEKARESDADPTMGFLERMQSDGNTAGYYASVVGLTFGVLILLGFMGVSRVAAAKQQR